MSAQFVLLGLIVLLPGRTDWAVRPWLVVACGAGLLTGLVLMTVGATALGRGLTAVPLPNRHAQLRTGGLYGRMRHPIYTGLLLAAASVAAASGSIWRLIAFGLLVVLLTVKARWEEARLTRRFPVTPSTPHGRRASSPASVGRDSGIGRVTLLGSSGRAAPRGGPTAPPSARRAARQAAA